MGGATPLVLAGTWPLELLGRLELVVESSCGSCKITNLDLVESLEEDLLKGGRCRAQRCGRSCVKSPCRVCDAYWKRGLPQEHEWKDIESLDPDIRNRLPRFALCGA